jgi:5-methyltetrahydrofolate--homocysteine methyltransferase
MEQMLRGIKEALIKGNVTRIKELIQSCLHQGINPQLVLEQGLIRGMDVIGERFKKDEIYLPEVMIAARAMNAGLEVLEPILSRGEVEFKGKIVLGTVRGDLHDVGKNLVSMIFRGAGFQVLDLGIDVPEETFVHAVEENRADILGLSALLTMTLPTMKTTIDTIEEAGLRESVIIMVGGAPVTQRFADEIGANGYAPDAVTAVERARELMSTRQRRRK